jgi:cytochrome c-type biogenesis protein
LDRGVFDLAARLLMMIDLGINSLSPSEVKPFLPKSRFKQLAGAKERHNGKAGSLLLGPFPVFGFHWSLPVLIWLISQNVTPIGGAMMLFVFGVGHGVPVIPIATFSRAVGGQIGEKYLLAGKYVTRVFGLAVIVIGLVYAVRYLGYKMW